MQLQFLGWKTGWVDGIRVGSAEDQISECEYVETAGMKQEKRLWNMNRVIHELGPTSKPNMGVMESLYERESNTEKTFKELLAENFPYLSWTQRSSKLNQP